MPMTLIVLWTAAIVVVAVAPVMISARLLGAARTGFGAALLAVIAQAVLSALARLFAPGLAVIIGLMVVGGSAIYAWVLGTTLLRGFGISILATVITAVATMILGTLVGGMFGAVIG